MHKFIGQSILIDGKNALYVVSVHSGGNPHSEIWKVEKESFCEKVILDNQGVEIVVVEYVDGDLIWYMEERYSRGYLKYSEKNLPNYKGRYELPLGYNWRDYGCTEGIRTKNYELLQRTIFGMKDRGIVCKFDRIMRYGKRVMNGQVIGIYEKDIFVGVRMGGKDLIKIDLRDEKEPIVLPVYKK